MKNLEKIMKSENCLKEIEKEIFDISFELPAFDTIISENTIDKDIADEEFKKDKIDIKKVCSTCHQYYAPFGCGYNMHTICDRIFNAY